jgi:CBS domain-containing protein/uncharacterized protein (DUF2267 family)
MSLERFCRGRLVVLDPGASAYDAARAMEDNRIGCVVVQERGRLAGVVTDRDLALRVLAAERRPSETPLRDVMTAEPVTLHIEASEEEALELMRDERVRRLPIFDDGRLAGVVTLDDLILSGEVGAPRLAAVVRAQLAEPARQKPYGATHPVRARRRDALPEAASATRAEQTLRDFAVRIQEMVGLDSREQALTAFEVVAGGLVRRLTPEEARDFTAQLPSRIRERLLALPPGPDREVTRATMVADMARRLDLDDAVAATIVHRIGGALWSGVSEGELKDLRSQLPDELKEMLDAGT